jgi:hypothetical protein
MAVQGGHPFFIHLKPLTLRRVKRSQLDPPFTRRRIYDFSNSNICANGDTVAVRSPYMVSKIFQFIWAYKLWSFFVALVLLATGTGPMIWRSCCWHFRDFAVLDFLNKKRKGKTEYGGRVFHPASVTDVAQALNRSEKSIARSLKRLRKGRIGEPLVVEVNGGWYTKENAPTDLVEKI